MKKLLITGASGFLGYRLCQRAKSEWDVFGTFFTHRLEIPKVKLMHADLTRFQETKSLFQEISPDAVIHTAAITKPDYCQQYPDHSTKMNVAASAEIAGLCSDHDIPLVFTSSDLAFDGLNPPYSETDDPSPVCVYGEQKVHAELEMKNRYPNTVICRMALMFGAPAPTSSGFLQIMIQSMRSNDGAYLFTDEFRTPLSAQDASEGLLMALKKRPGILHLGGPERLSRHDFGKSVAGLLEINDAKFKPCLQKDLDLPAPRSPDVSLDISKARSLGFQPRSLTSALSALKTLQVR